MADEGKRDGRCKGMGDVRDGKVLRDIDSWRKKEKQQMRGDVPNEIPLLTCEQRCYQKSHLQFTRIKKKRNLPIHVGLHYLMNLFFSSSAVLFYVQH